MSYIGNPKVKEGGQKKNITADWESHELLSEILKQLKIMNLHLALMTDTQIRKQDMD